MKLKAPTETTRLKGMDERNDRSTRWFSGLLIQSVGNISTAYNLGVIDHALLILRESNASWGPGGEALVASCSLVGAIIGQLSFGIVGDMIGRNKGMVMTLLLTIMGALASAVLTWGENSYFILALSRLVLGLGVGGVYPLSATSAAEASSDERRRGQRVAFVFSFQGVGFFLAATAAFTVNALLPDCSYRWRILLGIGALPGILVFRSSLPKMREDDEFRSLQGETRGEALRMNGSEVSSMRHFSEYCRRREFLTALVGTAGTWFLFDYSFYGNVIFAPQLLQDAFDVQDKDLVQDAAYSIAITLVAFPGYLVSIFLIDKLGHKWIQMQGFAVVMVLFILIGAFYDSLQSNGGLLFALYSLTFFFSNFGPNCTTFSLPSKVFPKEVRARCNGISAAVGKLGATVGAITFGPLEASAGIVSVLLLSALVSFLGLIFTLVFIPKMAGPGFQQVPLAADLPPKENKGDRVAV